MHVIPFLRALPLLLIAAAIFAPVHAAGVGIIAETQTIAAGSFPVCTAPCECISEAEAAARWGSEGYDRCSKSICGQSPDAMVQYYCLRPIGGSSSSAFVTCEAPCECMAETAAAARWGANGYSQCTKTLCGQDTSAAGSVPKYCYRQWGSAGLVIGGAATTAPAAVQQLTMEATTIPPAQGQQAPQQTQPQAQVPAATSVVTTTDSYTWPAPGAVPQKTPGGIATVLAALGAAGLFAIVLQRK